MHAGSVRRSLGCMGVIHSINEPRSSIYRSGDVDRMVFGAFILLIVNVFGNHNNRSGICPKSFPKRPQI